MDGQKNIERTWKVREKSGNLKINKMAMAVFRKFILFKRGKDVLLMRLSKPISLLIWGYS